MALIHKLAKWYSFINEDLADPRTKDFFLIGSIWPVVTVIGFYLYFVYDLGPRFMEKRQPYKLDRLLQLYDILQILFNLYVFYKALDLAWLRGYSLTCEPIDYSSTPRAIEIAKMVWKFFLVKIIDLMDTVFFVLRKKQNQVSFLHVYHHAGMVAGTWIASKYLAGGHVTFLGVVNSFVHIIMYIHYLLSSMKVNTSKWKKHITQLQLVQFFLIMLHYTQLAWVEDCGFPVWTAAVMVPQNFFMIVLFGEFYYDTYIKKKSTDKEALARKTDANGVPAQEIPNGKRSKEQ